MADLLNYKSASGSDDWYIVGDFNTVLHTEERLGKRINNINRECKDFKIFVLDMNLIDLPSVGGRFTWFNGSGMAMSRLNRFILSDKLVHIWKLIAQRVGKRELFDHCLVWLEDDCIDWVPKPFRFNNCWFNHEEFGISYRRSGSKSR